MNNHADRLERARFLATVKDLGDRDQIPTMAFALVLELTEEYPAPWAESDPLAAERYLAARGASPAAAAANARAFEEQMRALFALHTGRYAETFDELADWISTHVDGGPR